MVTAEDSPPRCLVCDVALEAPTGGGRIPRFCSGAHRARYNRDKRDRPHPSLSTPAADTAPAIKRFEAALESAAAAGRDLVAAAASSHALSAALTLATARAEQAEADRDAARRGIVDVRGQVTALQETVGALRAQLAAERHLLVEITAERERLTAGGR